MRIGIDLGGTKIEACLLDARGEIVRRERRETPQGDYDATVRVIAALATELEAHAGEPATVGVGTPGSVSSLTGLMKNCNSIVLNGRALQHDLAVALGREVRIANDANCFALSEATDGAARDARCVFGVILGTGVGGGIVLDRRIWPGADGVAGEWGHNPLPWPRPGEWPGPDCYCGRTGCIETLCSGPAIAREHGLRTGDEVTATEIGARSLAGDAEASATIELLVDRLARGLAHVINVLDPDAIVLGGGLSNLDRLYDDLPARLAAFVFSDTLRAALQRPVHGDSSGVRGAAWLWGPGEERGETQGR